MTSPFSDTDLHIVTYMIRLKEEICFQLLIGKERGTETRDEHVEIGVQRGTAHHEMSKSRSMTVRV
jgi:hypothetical protein